MHCASVPAKHSTISEESSFPTGSKRSTKRYNNRGHNELTETYHHNGHNELTETYHNRGHTKLTEIHHNRGHNELTDIVVRVESSLTVIFV